MEAKDRIKKGDRIWQIAFGSGFNCISAVCCALRTDVSMGKNPQKDEILEFPTNITLSISEVSCPNKIISYDDNCTRNVKS